MAVPDKLATTVDSFLDRSRDIVMAKFHPGPLWEAWRRHAQELGLLPDERECKRMEQMIAAVVLYLALHPPDEFVACTLNLRDPPLNLFVCGDNAAFQVTGRIYVRNIKTTTSDRLFVESQRPHHEPRRSVVDVDADTVLGMFEQFFLKSEQIPTRLFLFGGSVPWCAMIQGLPSADKKWLLEIDQTEARKLLEQPPEHIETRRYVFACGCHPKKILGVVHGMFKDKPQELFGGKSQVEVACPRCGKRYWITREDFDKGPGGVGAA